MCVFVCDLYCVMYMHMCVVRRTVPCVKSVVGPIVPVGRLGSWS